ncbi:MAG: metal ABC transporter substrate-binding protein [Candidatus Brocadiaceae bacterium]|nr:metal ABC transporter substrate-binding protein [Candidatus Brocadiaceae bacterium]
MYKPKPQQLPEHLKEGASIMKIIRLLLIGFFLCIICMTSVSYAKKITIVTSTADLAALAEEIGKDKVKVMSIAKPTEDPHFVDAKPSFMVKLNRADLFIESGLELEIGWLPTLVIGARNNKILPGKPGYLLASSGIRAIEVPAPEMSDRLMGDIHPLGNPHYMLDPLNGKIVAGRICDRLCQIDPENCDCYKSNLYEFTQKLNRKLSEWQSMLSPFLDTKIITYHKTWGYFAERFQLNIIGELEPKPGIPPSPSHLKNLIWRMNNEEVKLIIISSFREQRSPEFVAAKTGAKVLALPIMPGGQKETMDYIDMFDHIVNQIVSALKTKTT